MLTLAYPWMLIGLAALPLVFRRRGKPLALPLPTLAWIGPLRSRRGERANRWGRWVPPIALGLLIVAAAGPRWRNPETPADREGIALALVVDVSASMGDVDFLLDGKLVRRIDGARSVLRLLIAGGAGPGAVAFPGRPQDQVGLVVFATRPDTACPLTADHAALLKMLDEQDTRTGALEATTNPGDAIAWATRLLQASPIRRKAILLITDGEANVLPPALSPRQAAQLAGNLGIPVHALDASQDSDGPDAAKARKILEDVAVISKGGYYRAADGSSLLEAVRSIDRLERDRVAGLDRPTYRESAVWFVLAALVGFVGLMVAESTVWRRLP